MIYLPENDGIDHINVFSRGKTALGRKLTNFYKCVFIHPEYGEFHSVEAYWYFIKLISLGIYSDEIKKTHGFKAKELGKKLLPIKDIDTVDSMTPEFKELILEGIRLKFRQNKDILKELTYSTLPFAHYYWYGKDEKNAKVVTVDQYSWIIDEIYRIRTVCRKHLNLDNLIIS